MNFTVSLVVGDWSHDGHKQTDTITISSNLSSDLIETSYDIGKEILGFDFIQTCCVSYEDNQIEFKYVEKLEKAGYDFKNEEKTNSGAVKVWDAGLYANIYLFIVKLGHPDFEWEKTKSSDINIGGYGIYSD